MGNETKKPLTSENSLLMVKRDLQECRRAGAEVRKLRTNSIQPEAQYLPAVLRAVFHLCTGASSACLRIPGKVSAGLLSQDLAAKENVHIPERKG